MLATSALDLAIESQMFVTNVIDAALVIGPLWIISIIVRVAAAPAAGSRIRPDTFSERNLLRDYH